MGANGSIRDTHVTQPAIPIRSRSYVDGHFLGEAAGNPVHTAPADGLNPVAYQRSLPFTTETRSAAGDGAGRPAGAEAAPANCRNRPRAGAGNASEAGGRRSLGILL